METENLVKLIKEFENSSSATSQLVDSMDHFKDILWKFNESYEEIKKARDEINQQALFEKVEGASNSLNIISDGIRQNLGGIIQTIEQINSNYSSGEKKINEVEVELAQTVASLNKIKISLKGIDEISQNINHIEANKLDLNLNMVSDNLVRIESIVKEFDSKYAKILESIENEIERHDVNLNVVINKHQEMLDKSFTKVNETSQMFAKYTDGLNKEIIDLVEKNDALKDVILNINRQNVDVFEAFTLLADEWAVKNIHGMAIKKKPK